MARGTPAPKATRPPDGYSNLKPGSTALGSNQTQFIGPGPIVPTPLQPAQRSKFKPNLKIPANYSA